MVLHRGKSPVSAHLHFSFSPLLVGDGLASLNRASMRRCLARFSPLLVGDGLASPCTELRKIASSPFQSPSRRGWSCITHHASLAAMCIVFQSPSRRGWSCILPDDTAGIAGAVFQSPSRRGWSCIAGFLLSHVPTPPCFSPLLVGDGLASIMALVLRSSGYGFQSPSRRGWSCIGASCVCNGVLREFQSPSRRGWSCITRRHGQYTFHHVFQSPSRRGWSCIPLAPAYHLAESSVSVPFS